VERALYARSKLAERQIHVLPWGKPMLSDVAYFVFPLCAGGCTSGAAGAGEALHKTGK
jgi:hypothetical protein